MDYIRKAVTQDASRIAEILIFTKRMNYREIFRDDDVSFGEMQVYPLAKSYIEDADKLANVWVYDDGIVKGMLHIEGIQIVELYVDTFFENQGSGREKKEQQSILLKWDGSRRTGKMKRRISFMIAALILALGFISCSAIPDDSLQEPDAAARSNPEDDIIPEGDPLAEAIIAAIAEQNKGKYLPGECCGVGYKIIETFEESDVLSVYTLTEYVEYRFEDNIFVGISGTNPKVLMRFHETEDNKYDLIFYTRLDLLSDLPEEKIEELLQPLAETGKDYIYTEQDIQEVRAQADEDAAEYLRSINRAAEVGARQNHEGKRLEELVSDDSLLDELFKDEEISLYPDWTGTTERLENGERYIYQTVFDEERQEIIYTKIEYSTNHVVKKQRFCVKSKAAVLCRHIYPLVLSVSVSHE